MKRILTTTLFAGLCLVLVAGPTTAQQREEYCDALKMLLQSAKDGFTQARTFKMAGASVCNVESDTRSYGCMWTFENVRWVVEEPTSTPTVVSSTFCVFHS